MLHLRAHAPAWRADEIDRALNSASGMLALAGAPTCARSTAGSPPATSDAALALDVYCYRIRKYVGAYLAALGRADAVVFTAGVGENDAVVRARSLAGLEGLGIAVDDGAQRARGERVISPAGLAGGRARGADRRGAGDGHSGGRAGRLTPGASARGDPRFALVSPHI